MVSFGRAGVLNNDIAEKLCHNLLSFDFCKTVPAVGIFRVNQVEYPYRITVFLQVQAQIRIQLGFGVGDDQAFPAFDALEYHISCISPAFHAAAGAKDRHVPVHSCLFREADGFSVQLSKDNAAAFCDVTHQLQHFLHLGISHKSGGAVGSLIGVGKVAFLVIGAFPSKAHPHDHENQQPEDAEA